jgi:hypothetical protein
MGHTRTAIVTAICLVVALGAVTPVVANDQFEPNDSLETATTLGPGTYTGLTLDDDESDYFAIDLERGETLNVTAAFPKQADGEEADNRPEVELLRADGTFVDQDVERTSPAASTVDHVLQYQSASDQTLFLHVYGRTSRDTATEYTLSVTRGANDRFESNGVPGTATSLEPGTYRGLTLLDDESDYFAIDLERGETLNASVAFPKQADGAVADNDPELRLYDASGDRLDVAEERTAPTSSVVRYVLQYQSDADQTVYLRVYGQSERDVATDYAMSVERGTNDRFEPNGVIGRAAPVGAGEYTGLTLLDAEGDWYAISLEDDDPLNVTVTFPKQADGEIADNRPEVQLYDANGDFLERADEDTSAVAETVTFTLQYDPGGDQTVYLLVSGQYDREVSTSYDMSITGPEPEGPPPITGDPPQDPDGDGEYEDVNGDGSVDVVDVQALFANLDDPAVRNNPGAFDFNGDGQVDVVDVQRLFNEL